MPYCTALNCLNSSEKGFRVHSFPVDLQRRQQWAQHLGRDFRHLPNGLPTTNMKLCEAHFTADQYVPDVRYGRKLKPDAVPTLFNGEILQVDHGEAENLQEEDHQAMDIDEDHQQDQYDADLQDNHQPHREHCQNAEHDIMEHLLEAENHRIQELTQRNRQLSERNHELQRQLCSALTRNDTFKMNLSTFLAEDQLKRLERNGQGQGHQWSASTIKAAIRIRMMTGVKGYEYLRTTVGYPLPSYRTLCRRLESCDFGPGLQSDIIPFLGSKLRGEEEINRNCFLAMDEMEIKKKVEYDKGLKKFIGFVTPEIAANEEEKGTVASKMLVFVVKGLTLKWKQTVAYFLTGSSINSEKLWECTSSIIRSLHDEGLNVRGVASDMGPNNVKMWRDLGIHAVEGSTRDSIDHPVVEGQRLYFTPDLAHLLKNTWTSLISQDFYLPDALAEENPEWQGHLTVSASHVRTLIELQDQPEDRGITMQYKLHKYHVEPSHLQKMKVRSAAEFFSRSTTIALRFCAENENIPEIDHQALPTAWFLEQVDRWFDIMNDRKYGIDGAVRGEQKLAELEDFRQLITSIKFQRRGWKPLQTGIILATTSTTLLKWTYRI